MFLASDSDICLALLGFIVPQLFLLWYLDPVAETHTVPPPPELLPEFELRPEEGAVTVPESCISYEDSQTYVYRCTKEDVPQQFEKQAVKVGLSDGVNIVVKEGLQVGDKIRGNEKTEEK